MALAVLVAVACWACGADDGAGVRATGSASGSGSGTGLGSGTSAGGGSEVAGCEPVGDSSSADTAVEVTLDEFSVTSSPGAVDAGTIEFELDNEGDFDHEFLVVRGPSPDSLPTNDDGAVDEDALGGGALIGEVEAFPPGGCEGTFALQPGSYVLLCNRVVDGTSHFQRGMATTFTVRG
jgi:hypothetical protein